MVETDICFGYRSCQIKCLVTYEYPKVQTRKIHNNTYLDELEKAINNVINQDIGIEKSSLGIRNQKCYAVKVECNTFALAVYLCFCIVWRQWIARRW